MKKNKEDYVLKRAAAIEAEMKSKSGIQFSLREIVGESGTDYGIGVYLDSELLNNLNEAERKRVVKNYVKDLGGTSFNAIDGKGNKVSVNIAKSNLRFKNSKGKTIPVNKDLSNKYIDKHLFMTVRFCLLRIWRAIKKKPPVQSHPSCKIQQAITTLQLLR